MIFWLTAGWGLIATLGWYFAAGEARHQRRQAQRLAETLRGALSCRDFTEDE